MIQVGYFGKTIHRGDFVRYNLPQSFITVMDDWIQAELIHLDTLQAQQTHKTDTFNRHQSDYGFYLSANIAGTAPWSGVIVPSTDKVGRRFPFCIAANMSESNSAVWSHSTFDKINGLLVDIARAFTRPDFNFDKSQELLLRASQLLDETIDNNQLGQDNFDLSIDTEQINLKFARENLEHIACSTLDPILQQAYFCYSFWIPLNESSKDHCLFTSGLPEHNNAKDMFESIYAHENTQTSALSKSTPASIEIIFQDGKKESPTRNSIHPTVGMSTSAGTPTGPLADEHNKSNISQSTRNPENTAELEKMVDPNEKLPLSQQPTVEPLMLDDDSTDPPWD